MAISIHCLYILYIILIYIIFIYIIHRDLKSYIINFSYFIIKTTKYKESACSAGDPGLIPGFRRPPGERKGCPLQYSWLQNSLDSGAWRATVHGSQRVGHNRAINTFTFHIMDILWVVIEYKWFWKIYILRKWVNP